MRILTCILLYLSTSLFVNSMATAYFPTNLLLLDEKFTHHIAIVEKSTHSLYLFENNEGIPELLNKYEIATGKNKGNKIYQGDHKTPEGIYILNNFYSSDFLSKKYGEAASMYGAGAFTLNYPNEIDRRSGKTGGGIWLHSTNDNSRIAKGLDSRGCVVVIDKDLKDISEYIDLKNTPMIILQELKYLNQNSWTVSKNEIYSSVVNWFNAWRNKNFNQYISHYSKTEFFHPQKGNFFKYRSYKRHVFARNDTPEIKFSNISILMHNNYAFVTLLQDYQSSIIKDIGKKSLILKRNKNYSWKIISENWSRIEDKNKKVAFTPSKRFFAEADKIKKTN